MTPLEPIRSVSPDNSANSGQFSGENEHAAELVDIGRRIAEEETRDAVTERYLDEANADDDTESALADFARAEAVEDRAEEVGPEPDVTHVEVPPEDWTIPLPYFPGIHHP